MNFLVFHVDCSLPNDLKGAVFSLEQSLDWFQFVLNQICAFANTLHGIIAALHQKNSSRESDLDPIFNVILEKL